MTSLINPRLGQHLHETGSIWNWYEIGMDKPSVYTVSDGSSMNWICHLVPNGSTYKGDPILNCTIPVSNQSYVNGVNLYHSGSNPKWI